MLRASPPRAAAHAAAALALAWVAACGTPAGDGADGSPPSGSVTSGGSLGIGPATGGSAPPVVCDAGTGAACVPSCAGGGDTTVEGTVYDPAGVDPLYGVAVYIPAAALPDPLPKGAVCGCAGLFPPVLAGAVTAPDGTFRITGAPAGPAVPIVVQTGKWRRVVTRALSACADNAVPDGTLRLPRSSAEGSLPDIAVSTGGADSLECLPLRVGVDPSEFVPGAGDGHIHIFAGYAGATTAATTPASSAALWDSTADLMKNDVVLLSCEGHETANITAQSRQFLADYASRGGRAFASHFHYAWLDAIPFASEGIASFTTGPQIVDDTAAVPADIDTALPDGGVFPEGAAMRDWLGVVGAIDGGTLPVWFARHNADVSPQMSVSQPWIALDPSSPAPGATQYFSFDMPFGGGPFCGRIVYSDLHVSGGPGASEPGVLPDYPDAGTIGSDTRGGIVPSGCALRPLTPQEKALEFMLFDLSSCLLPIGSTPEVPL